METQNLTPEDFITAPELDCEECYFNNVPCYQGTNELVDKLDKIHGKCNTADHVYQLNPKAKCAPSD